MEENHRQYQCKLERMKTKVFICPDQPFDSPSLVRESKIIGTVVVTKLSDLQFAIWDWVSDYTIQFTLPQSLVSVLLTIQVLLDFPQGHASNPIVTHVLSCAFLPSYSLGTRNFGSVIPVY